MGCWDWGLGFGVWALGRVPRKSHSKPHTYLRNTQTLNINRARTPSTLISLDHAPKPRTFNPHTQPLRTYTPNSYVQYPSTLSSKPQTLRTHILNSTNETRTYARLRTHDLHIPALDANPRRSTDCYIHVRTDRSLLLTHVQCPLRTHV